MRSEKYLTDSKEPFYSAQYIKLVRLDEIQNTSFTVSIFTKSLPFDDYSIQKKQKKKKAVAHHSNLN